MALRLEKLIRSSFILKSMSEAFLFQDPILFIGKISSIFFPFPLHLVDNYSRRNSARNHTLILQLPNRRGLPLEDGIRHMENGFKQRGKEIPRDLGRSKF